MPVFSVAAWVIGCSGQGSDAVEQSKHQLNNNPKASDFAVYAQNSASLLDRAAVVGGDLGVQLPGSGPFLGAYELTLVGGAHVDGTRNVLANRVLLRDRASVGDLQVNQVISVNNSTFARRYLFPTTMPALPPTAPVTPGTAALRVAARASATAAPGAYGTATVGDYGLLRLKGGVYHFASFKAGNNARIEALAPVQLRIADRFISSDRIFIGPAAGATLTSGDVRIEVSGKNGATGSLTDSPKAAVFGNDAKVSAVMLVPNGTLASGQRAVVIGAFVARDVLMDLDSSITYQSGVRSSDCLQSCDDGNRCTVDTCSGGVCVHSFSPAGASCEDGNRCNGAEKCDGAGYCQLGAPVLCTALDQCHTPGICDSVTGQCTNPEKPNGAACDDANPCTNTDVCIAGVCGGTPYTCDDGLDCTADTCDGEGTCNHSVLPGTCAIDGRCYANRTTNPTTACQVCDSSRPMTWTSQSDGTACNDTGGCGSGDGGAEIDGGSHCPHTCIAGRCTGSCAPGKHECDGLTPLVCDETGSWQNRPSCDDGNPCTADSCSAGICSHLVSVAGTSCSDSNACNGTEICDDKGQCQSGTAITACLSGDGCCPSGCTSSTDSDCTGVGAGTPVHLPPGPLQDARTQYLARASGIDLNGDGAPDWFLTWEGDDPLPVVEAIDADGNGVPEIRTTWNSQTGERHRLLDRDQDGIYEELWVFSRDVSTMPTSYAMRQQKDRDRDGVADWFLDVTGISSANQFMSATWSELDQFGNRVVQNTQLAPREQEAAGAALAGACPESLGVQAAFERTVAGALTCLSGPALTDLLTLLDSSPITILCDPLLKLSGYADFVHLGECMTSGSCDVTITLGAGAMGSNVILEDTIFHELLHYSKRFVHVNDSNDANDPVSVCTTYCFPTANGLRQSFCGDGTILDSDLCECRTCEPCPEKDCSVPTCRKGRCVYASRNDGAVCGTGLEIGDCVESQRVCKSGVCEVVKKPDGTPCDDGNKCTGLGTCQDGDCLAGPPKVCPGQNDPCFEPFECLPNKGCASVSLPKPDGTRCGEGRECRNGTCQQVGFVATFIAEDVDDSEGERINDSGDVSGSGYRAGSGDLQYSGVCFIVSDGITTTFGPLRAGDGACKTTGMNSNGLVVGWSDYDTAKYQWELWAFYYSRKDGMHPIPGLEEVNEDAYWYATGVNDAGAVVGSSGDTDLVRGLGTGNGGLSFLFDNEVLYDLHVTAGEGYGWQQIMNSGTLVGASKGDPSSIVLFEAGTVIPVAQAPSGFVPVIEDVSDNGIMAGYFTPVVRYDWKSSIGFVLGGGQTVFIASTRLHGVNSQGMAVGERYTTGTPVGILVDSRNGTTQDVQPPISGLTGGAVYLNDINNNGQIVGGMFLNSRMHAIRLDPK